MEERNDRWEKRILRPIPAPRVPYHLDAGRIVQVKPEGDPKQPSSPSTAVFRWCPAATVFKAVTLSGANWPDLSWPALSRPEHGVRSAA